MSAENVRPWDSFGKTLAAARERRGWLQSDLAKRLGVGQQTVSRWEKGTSRPEQSLLVKLAGFLPDHTPDEWMALGGYAQVAIRNSRQQTAIVAASPLLSALPLSTLSDDRFEDFCRDLVAALHHDAAVNRFGVRGDKQDGIDIEAVFRDGTRFVYQCKRYKSFGPKKIREAVRALKTRADRAHILLSRQATAAARKAITPYRNWDLWDNEYISLVVRQELPRDQACRLVDTYFPGLRQGFLGITDPNPFLAPDHYFAPFLKRTIFSHVWNLVGRQEAVDQVCAILERDPRSVAILSGSGGIGKSRTVRGICDHFERAHPGIAVRLVDSATNVTPKDFDLLRGQETLLVVDDAHDRSDVNIIYNFVARSPDTVRLLLVTRPYALPVIKVELTRAGLFLPEDSAVPLKRLQRGDVENLSREILTALNGPIAAVQDIARVTADSPLATVVGSYLVATRRIHPSVLSNEEDFRQQLYGSFEDAITGELGKVDDPGIVRDVLGLFSLLQPIDPDDPNFRSVAEQVIGKPIDKILLAITRLHESGVLLKRGRRFRIVPDLLGEYIIETRCVVGASRSSSGFAECVAGYVGAELLRHLIVNFSRLDWRLSRSAQETNHIVEQLWHSLTESFEHSQGSRGAIVKAISEAAYYQPARALSFADLVIRVNGELSPEIPRLLKRVAYNYEFVGEACKRLWALGRNDARALHQHPDHPVRILCELAAIEPDKPVAYCEAVIDFALREVKDSANHGHANSLFEVLEAALKTEGHRTQSRGYSISFTPFTVRFAAVRALRQKVIDALLGFVQEGHSLGAVRAARAIHDALRYPMGLLGANPGSEERNAWTPEFLETLGKIRDILAGEKIDPVVAITLQKSFDWHARYHDGPTRAAAVEANIAIPRTLQYRVTLDLLDGWGHLREKHDDYNAARKELEIEVQATVRDLLAEHPTPDDVRKFMEERFTEIRRLHGSCEAVQLFISTLIEASPGVGKVIWSTAISEGATYPLVSILDCILGKLIDQDPAASLEIARRALSTGRYELSRAVSFAYGWGCGRTRPPTDGEISLLAQLCIHDDATTITGVIRALERVAAKDKGRALDLFLSIDFEKGQRLAHEAFMVFLHEENLRVDSLDAESLGKILAKLLPVPSIEDYWVSQFLGKASKNFPDEILKFLFQRIERERSLKEKQSLEYDSIPWHWGKDAKLAFRDQPDFAKYVVAIAVWLRGKSDWIAKKRAAVFFSLVCRGYDNVTLTALSPVLFSSDQETVQGASTLLAEAPPDFVFTQNQFVVRLLEHASSLGKETLGAVGGDLWSSAISGVKSGTPGQPFPEDIQMLDKTVELLATLPKGSPAWEFYATLKRHADREIQRSKDEALEEFEEE